MSKSSQLVSVLHVFIKFRHNYYVNNYRMFHSKKPEAYKKLDLSSKPSFLSSDILCANRLEQLFSMASKIGHKSSCDAIDRLILPYFVEGTAASMMKHIGLTQTSDKAYLLKVFNCIQFQMVVRRAASGMSIRQTDLNDQPEREMIGSADLRGLQYNEPNDLYSQLSLLIWRAYGLYFSIQNARDIVLHLNA